MFGKLGQWATNEATQFGNWVGNETGFISNDEDKYKAQLSGVMKTRPTYQAPQSEIDYLNQAKEKVNTTMPEYDQMLSDINSSTNAGLSNIQKESNSASSTLGAAGTLFSKARKSTSDLGIQQDQYTQQMKEELAKAYQVDAEYQDKAWNWNDAKAYEEKYNYTQSQLQGAEQDKATKDKNIMSLVSGLTKVGGSIIGGLL
jgi:alpha-tubulin suppressor-like RCC1 family protein